MSQGDGMGVIARTIAAEMTPMYVRDGTSDVFEAVDMAAIVEHVLIVAGRSRQPPGAVEALERIAKAARVRVETRADLPAQWALDTAEAALRTGGQ